MWGDDHVMIYNDGYVEVAATTIHARARATSHGIWPEIWDWNRQDSRMTFAARSVLPRPDDGLLHRHGVPEEVFDLFYTPIYDDDGKVEQVSSARCRKHRQGEGSRGAADSREG